jgi:pyrroline-5-carboxylate reductase
MNENTVAFIGAGNMARSVIAALIKQGYPAANIIASNRNPQKLAALASDFAIQTTEDNTHAAQLADVIVLAVKPQFMAEVCQAMLAGAPEIHEKLFVTVAAGLPVSRYREWLGDIRIVRAMPNTPAQIGLGITGLYPSQCSNYEKSFVDQLFRGCGRNVWLEQEAQINHITAISGSAPAYFFYFMEAMQQQAEALGFATEEARAMVAQTALGAATLAAQSDLSFADLRAQVTSKGGTTHEAIETFRARELQQTVAAAMQAAIARAEAIAETS